jgi:iron complex outermembrane receptor protein
MPSLLLAAARHPRDGRTRAAPAPGPLLAATVAGLLASSLGAQQPTATPPSDSVVQIPPLEVIVLRSPLAGARSPFAVSGLDAGELRRSRSAAFLGDALLAMPGLEIQNRHNLAVGERVAVRGFGARAQFGVRGVRVVVDGIPATLPDGQTTLDHLDLASLGRVELLRGPGSALYGNGAGGVLVLESRRPDPGRRALVRGSGGSDGLVEGSVQLEDGSAAGDAGTLASFSRFDYAGYRADPVTGGTYGAADRLTVNVRHLRPLARGRLALTLAGVDLDAENPGSLPSDSLGDPDRSAWGANVRQRTGKTVRQAQGGASWRGPLAGLEGELAAWGAARDVRNPIPSDVIGLERLAGGVRAAVEGGLLGLVWGAGVDLEAMRDERTNHENDAGDEGALTLDRRETVRALGLHARVSGDAGPASLHAALRHDRVRFAAEDRLQPIGGDQADARSLTGWSPSLGVLVTPGAGVALFASVSTFLETPTTTELTNRPDGGDGFNPELEPTRGWTLEGGVRGRLGERLGWELVGFHSGLQDELVPFEVPDVPGRTFYRNAGRSRHRGVEVAVRAALPGGVSGRAAYTRVDARFRTPAGDAEAGDRIPGRSPGRFEVVVDAKRGVLTASADLAWNDATPVDDADTEEAPSYTLLGVRLGAEGWTVGALGIAPFLSLRNLLDEDYVASVVPNAFGGRYFEPGPGRQLRAGLSVSFGR